MIEDLEARILYEKNGVIIFNKPPGIPTSGRSLDSEDCVQYWLMKRHGGMVWAVHQLDADTSGVNIFVIEKKLVLVYKNMMENKESNKEYLAIVHGNPDWDECEEFGSIGMIDERSLGINPDGKSAHSRFTVAVRSDNFSLVRVRIFTGRTHQIRIHLSHLGHPIVGEEWYCKPPCLLHPRQALHCARIYLPESDETFNAPLTSDLQKLLTKLDLGNNSWT